jgi:hypothetical protein
MKILLIENASVRDLIEIFLQKLGNRRVPPGSVILVFSATFLATVGLELYTLEMQEAERRIHNVLGRETIFQPLPPILLGGTSDSNLIRSLFELIEWSTSFYAGNDYLEGSSLKAKSILQDLGTGLRATLESRRYALPVRDDAKKKVWASVASDNMCIPISVKPLTAAMESDYVTGIIAEMKEKWALDLDPSPKHDRALGPQTKPKRKVDILVVGSSNAQRLGAAL